MASAPTTASSVAGGAGRVVPGVAANRGLELLRRAERLRVEAVSQLSFADNHEIAAVRGFLSPSRMIAFETTTSQRDADILARVARFIGTHPKTAAALAEARVSIAQVDQLARAAVSLDDAYDRDEEQLLEACAMRDVEELARFLAQWRWSNDKAAAQADAGRASANRGVTIQEGFDGSGSARVRLDAQGLSVLVDALETTPDPTGSIEGPRTLAQRRADRLVGICAETLADTPTTHNHNHNDDNDGDLDHDVDVDVDVEGGRRESEDAHTSEGASTVTPPTVPLSAESTATLLRLLAGEPPEQIGEPPALAELLALFGLPSLQDLAMGAASRSTADVIIDINTLLGDDPASIETIRATLADGRPIPEPVWQRLVCDTSVRRVLMAGKSQVLDYGRATPDISPALRRAVKRRDLHCQFRGCNTNARWCDVHHLTPWNDGGVTAEPNLACVCRRHHTLIHEGGWQLHRDKNGQIVTTSP